MYGFFYRSIMRIAHRFNWHYAPPIYPEGDTHLWCKWCGFRQTIKKSNKPDLPDHTPIHNSLDAGDEDGVIAQKIYQNLVERTWHGLKERDQSNILSLISNEW